MYRHLKFQRIRLKEWWRSWRTGMRRRIHLVEEEDFTKRKTSTPSMTVTSISIKRLNELLANTRWRSRTILKGELLCLIKRYWDYIQFMCKQSLDIRYSYISCVTIVGYAEFKQRFKWCYILLMCKFKISRSCHVLKLTSSYVCIDISPSFVYSSLL